MKDLLESLLKNKILVEKIVVDDGVTTTSEFLNWFRGSKIVDSSGNPQVMYHGTDKKFDKFEYKKGIRTTLFHQQEVNSSGFFFAASEESAKEYGDIVMPAYLRLKNPLIYGKDGIDGIKDKKRIEDFKYIVEPAIERDSGDEYFDIGIARRYLDISGDPEWYMNAVGGSGLEWDLLDIPEVVSRMKERGYDGTYVKENIVREGFSVFVISPDQIMLATIIEDDEDWDYEDDDYEDDEYEDYDYDNEDEGDY